MPGEFPPPPPPQGSEGSPSKRASEERKLIPPLPIRTPEYKPTATLPGAGENLPIRPVPITEAPGSERLFTNPPQPPREDRPPRARYADEPVDQGPEATREEQGRADDDEDGPSFAEKAHEQFERAGRFFKGTIDGIKEHPLYARCTVPVRLAAANYWLGREAKAYKKSERKHRDAQNRSDLWQDQADLLEDAQRDLVGAGFSLRNDRVGKKIEKARGRSNRFADKAEDAEEKLIEKRSSVEVKADVRNAVADEMLTIYDQGASKIQDKIESFERKSGLAGVRHELVSAEIKLETLENSLAESKRKIEIFKKRHGNELDLSEVRRMHSDAEKAIEKAKKIKEKLVARKNAIESRVARLDTKKVAITSKKDQLQRAIDGSPFDTADLREERGRRNEPSGRERSSDRLYSSESEPIYNISELVATWNAGYDPKQPLYINPDFYSQSFDQGSRISAKDFVWLLRSYIRNLKGVKEGSREDLTTEAWANLSGEMESGVLRYRQQRRR